MKNITGATGEYFVAAELSQREIVTTLTLKNTPYIDILASILLTGQTANIQVKTMSITNNQGGRLGINDQEKSNIKNHFYVFVNLKGPSALPEYIIIPKNTLASFIKKRHSEWLLGNKKDDSAKKIQKL